MPPPAFEAHPKKPVVWVSVITGTAFCVGLALLASGCWMAWPPLGFIVGGLILTAGATFYERGSAVSSRRRQ
jgi:hypothetical protein